MFGRISTTGDILDDDPLPLSPGQAWALISAATRQLLWGLRAVSYEVRQWRRRALAIPDALIRVDALDALARKRTHLDGAALFWALPRRRDPQVLRLLVAYEIAVELLDNLHEREPAGANGRQLHRALVEALDPSAPISDYYLHHPWRDDGGYLCALVQTCREVCATLPCYPHVRERLLLAARRCGEVQSINHEPESIARRAMLSAWARREFPDLTATSWWEATAAASSSVIVHVLLALAARSSREDLVAVDAAYVPWICAASTMLDSYVDQARDLATGDHSYVAHYPSTEIRSRRMHELIVRSAGEARSLPDGHRHAVIVACMVAMYMSGNGARAPSLRDTTAGLVQAGGSLTKLLVPVLRCWRTVYALRSV